MGYSFDSDEAKVINEKIFEHIYYGSMKKSMEISKDRDAKFVRIKQIIENLYNDTELILYLKNMFSLNGIY